jgi:hypothetical protein
MDAAVLLVYIDVYCIGLLGIFWIPNSVTVLMYC